MFLECSKFTVVTEAALSKPLATNLPLETTPSSPEPHQRPQLHTHTLSLTHTHTHTHTHAHTYTHAYTHIHTHTHTHTHIHTHLNAGDESLSLQLHDILRAMESHNHIMFQEAAQVNLIALDCLIIRQLFDCVQNLAFYGVHKSACIMLRACTCWLCGITYAY
jgi:hypothetical protein